jgi:hypothetical protein
VSPSQPANPPAHTVASGATSFTAFACSTTRAGYQSNGSATPFEPSPEVGSPLVVPMISACVLRQMSGSLSSWTSTCAAPFQRPGHRPSIHFTRSSVYENPSVVLGVAVAPAGSCALTSFQCAAAGVAGVVVLGAIGMG